jgi:NFU1 iron-sulfur cluster scaffold homolog, mitochondrial
LTERTPNPDAMKFTPHVRLTRDASFSFAREGFDPDRSALAARLFALAGVGRVYVASDFVTVIRTPDAPSWAELRYPALTAIADHLASGEPAVAGASSGMALAGEDPVEEEIRNVLVRHVQPGVARDGGEIVFDRFEPDTGVLWIRMQGACGGCPSARLTLKAGVENIVRRYVPEVSCVQEAAVEAEPRRAHSRVKGWLASFGGRQDPPPRVRFTHAGREMAGPPPIRASSDASAPVKAD